MKRSPAYFLLTLVSFLSLEANAAQPSGQFYFGWATADITPHQPVAICGQYHTRISGEIHDPVQATALAIETRHQDQSLEQAVFVSCDLVGIRGLVQERLRKAIQPRVPDLDPRKVFISATHSHTSPALTDTRETHLHPHDFMGSWAYRIPKDRTEVMHPVDYCELLVDRMTRAVVNAWSARKPGGMSSALGHATIAHNRRAVYTDGTTRMYGGTHEPNFSHIEGVSDHSVDLLCLWRGDQLDGLAINVYCPSQEVENQQYLSADFWYDTRKLLREKYSGNLHILPLCGAAGDQSPHLMWNKNPERSLLNRAGRSPRQEIAHRLVHAIQEAMPRARATIQTTVPFEHRVSVVPLPVWKISEARLAEAKNRFHAGKDRTDQLASNEYIEWRVSRTLMNRFEHQQTDPNYHAELHFLRLGDLAVATNPFELYTDYGVRMKARSPASHTLVIQLTADCAGYLPTRRAVAGGGYSARIVNGVVGPKGGDVLVNRSAEILNDLWEPSR